MATTTCLRAQVVGKVLHFSAMSGRRKLLAAGCRAASNGSQAHESPDVRQLARLAQIGVTDEEVIKLAGSNWRMTDASSGTGGRDSSGGGAANVWRPATQTALHAMVLQVADWQPKIAGIVEWFGQLQEIDVEGVPPALRADVGDDSRLRADEPRQYEHQDALLAQVPEREGAFVRVPKIATAADN